LLRKLRAPLPALPLPRGFVAPIPLRGLRLHGLLRKPRTLTSALPLPRAFGAPPSTEVGLSSSGIAADL